jgi:hypothetical protein
MDDTSSDSEGDRDHTGIHAKDDGDVGIYSDLAGLIMSFRLGSARLLGGSRLAPTGIASVAINAGCTRISTSCIRNSYHSRTDASLAATELGITIEAHAA